MSADLGEAGAQEIRSMLDSVKDKGSDIIAVFAGKQSDKGTCSFGCYCAPDAMKLGAHAGNIVREVASVAGGSGGGKPDSAMAGGKDPSKIQAALSAVTGIVESKLK